MLIDDITIKVIAGNGGEGRVAFDKTKMAKGPAGGNGGEGGDIYFEGVSDLSALKQFRYQKKLKQTMEKMEREIKRWGKGENVVLKIPVGTIVHNLSNGQKIEITKIGDRVLIAKGGRGGKGNYFLDLLLKQLLYMRKKGFQEKFLILDLNLS